MNAAPPGSPPGSLPPGPPPGSPPGSPPPAVVGGGAPPDALLSEIADYLLLQPIEREEAYQAAVWSLADSLGCAMLALQFPECRRRLGPLVEGAVTPGGCRVPGTGLELDPVQGAFNLGAMIRWLDYNDTWLAAEWGHPSDNLGGLLCVADWMSRSRPAAADGQRPVPVSMRRLLEAQIRAYEIQGVLALENSFNRVGLDHVILVKVATAGTAAWLLGGDRAAIVSALSNAWIDAGPLRTYRHAPNTGARKSWAAADATSRGVRLALMAIAGEPAYPAAITAPRWGVQDALLDGKPLRLGRALGSYVAENILFKVSFPAEFHAQTAVEAALALHPQVRDRLDRVRRVRIRTQESAIRIIDKRGPLHNAADRDHCIQYAVAVALIHGGLRAEHYEAEASRDPRIDALREKMEVVENPRFSSDYLDPERRSIANSLQLWFEDGTATEEVTVEYPLGHRRRRSEGIPLLFDKLRRNLAASLPPDRAAGVVRLFEDRGRLEGLDVPGFVDRFV